MAQILLVLATKSVLLGVLFGETECMWAESEFWLIFCSLSLRAAGEIPSSIVWSILQVSWLYHFIEWDRKVDWKGPLKAFFFPVKYKATGSYFVIWLTSILWNAGASPCLGRVGWAIHLLSPAQNAVDFKFFLKNLISFKHPCIS